MILSNYYATDDGRIFNRTTNQELRYYKSNKYLQCTVYDDEGRRHIFGVHTVIARLRLPEFFEGCVVHHKDEDPYNNRIDNLECMTNSDHARLHASSSNHFAEYIRKYGPANKGKQMSDEFKEHCKQSALKRVKRQQL